MLTMHDYCTCKTFAQTESSFGQLRSYSPGIKMASMWVFSILHEVF